MDVISMHSDINVYIYSSCKIGEMHKSDCDWIHDSEIAIGVGTSKPVNMSIGDHNHLLGKWQQFATRFPDRMIKPPASGSKQDITKNEKLSSRTCTQMDGTLHSQVS